MILVFNVSNQPCDSESILLIGTSLLVPCWISLALAGSWERVPNLTILITSIKQALIAEKTKVSNSKEKVVVSLDFERSEADDFSKLKKIIALLEKAFNRRKFYSKPTNNNLRTSSTSQSANNKQEFGKLDDKQVVKKGDEKKRDVSRVKCYNCKKEGNFPKDCKKANVKDYEYYKTKILLAKKDKDEQVLLAEDQAWMESSKASSSSADEKISEVTYYLSESESESEFEILEYYNNSTNNGLFVNNDDDQEIFHDAIESAMSIAGTSSTEQPPLKDKSMWSYQEKRIQKIDHLARSLLIQGLSNDIYSLIDINKTAKDLWDALARHMLGFEYGEQDRKAVVLYEYETFKATEGELLLDTYIRYLQVINELKKCGYSKKIIALIAEKTKVSKSKEKVVVSLDFERSEADDFSELKKIIALLEKAFNRRKFYSKPTNNNLRTSSTSQSANNKQEFGKLDDKQVVKKGDEKKRDVSRVKCYNCKKEGNFPKDCKKAKVKDYEYYKTKMLLAKKDKDEHVLLAEDQAWMESSKASSSSADEKIYAVTYYLSESESESEFEILEYYDNSTNNGLFVNNDDDQEIFHDAIESARIGFENPSYFEKAKDLRPTLYDEKVIGLGYTLMFLTNSDEALEIEKFKRSRENKIEFAYDYGNLNASYVNEKINFEDYYFQDIINPDFEKIDSPFQ
nr:hypothetical protein [Tanacetum cinerariifolium]